MRLDVKKYLFVGIKEEQTLFFEKAQQLGIVHFIDSQPSIKKEFTEPIERYHQAIKILRTTPPAVQEELDHHRQADKLVDKILALQAQIDKDEEELRITDLEIARVGIYGHFNLADIAYIQKEGHRQVQFFFTKQDALDKENLEEGVIYIASDHGLDYYIAITKEPFFHDKMVDIQIHEPLNELKARHKRLDKDIHTCREQLNHLSKYLDFLNHSFRYKLDDYSLESTKEYAESHLDNSLFAVEGWVPINKQDLLKDLTSELYVHSEEIAIEPDDVIPTYLENTGLAKVGEDLVHIYDTPSPTDQDPSLWVLGAFALFFSMIINDAGYGFIFLALTGYLYYRIPKRKPYVKRFLKLMTVLSVSCILWGFLTNSFFGLSIGYESPLRKFSILNWMAEKNIAYHQALKDNTWKGWVVKFPEVQTAKNPAELIHKIESGYEGKVGHEFLESINREILFELALFIGVLHISVSFLRYLTRNWSGIGWIIFLIGAYLYFPAFLGVASISNYIFGIPPEVAAQQGLIMIYGGIGIALVLALIHHKWLGFIEIAHIVQIFADVLSYLRLYALGLAGAIIAITINEFASLMPFAIATVLVMIAHLVNMFLGIMGGVIHGLRLNFLESYHYSFEGGGKLFNPLRLLSKE